MATILLVEDDTMNRDMISRYLAIEGYQVLTAGDGEEAVALAHAQKPDLILMDMGLPVLNGWQAVERIKSSPEVRSIPIIALTAYAMAEERRKCFEVGCNDYETKPIDFSRLRTKIRTLLNCI